MPHDLSGPTPLAPAWLRPFLDSANVPHVACVRDGEVRFIALGRCPACAEAEQELGAERAECSAWLSLDGTLHCRAPMCGAREAPMSLPVWARTYFPHAASLLPARFQPVAPIPARLAAAEVRRAIAKAVDFAAGGSNRVAVVDVTAGAGKTQQTTALIHERGVGTLLAPNYRLRDEQHGVWEASGGPPARMLSGTVHELRQAGSTLAPRLEAWSRHGYPPRWLLGDEDVPAANRGDEAVAFGVHAHLSLMPVARAPPPPPGAAQEGEVARPGSSGGENRAPLYAPIFIDEAPQLVEVVKLTHSQLTRFTVTHADGPLDAFLRARRPLLAILGAACDLAARRDRPSTARHGPHPRYIHGQRLAALMEEAAGSQTALEAAFRTCPATARWFEPTAAEEGGWWVRLDLGGRGPALYERWPPLPRAEDARRGAVRWWQWPPARIDFMLAAVAKEVLGARWPSARDGAGTTTWREFSGVASLAVADSGPRRRVLVEARSTWNPRALGDSSFVILDATAPWTFEALGAAWPGRRVKLFPLHVAPNNPDDVKYVQLETGRGSLSRRSLLRLPRRNGERGALSKRGAAALVRVIIAAADQLHHSLGAAGRLVVFVPKSVRLALQAAAHLAQCELLGRQPHRRCRPGIVVRGGTSRVQATISDLYRRGVVRRIAFASQGNTRGSNRFEKFHAALTLPFCPNIGAVNEDARALGIDADLLRSGLAEAELEQEWQRIRAVRATESHRKLVMHAGPVPPASWPTRFTVIQLPGGGRIPSDQSAAVEGVVRRLLHRHRAVGAAFAEWVIADVVRYEAVFGPSPGLAQDAAVARGAGDRMVQRVVGRVARPGAPVRVPNPLGGRGRWTLRELADGAAMALAASVARLRE